MSHFVFYPCRAQCVVCRDCLLREGPLCIELYWDLEFFLHLIVTCIQKNTFRWRPISAYICHRVNNGLEIEISRMDIVHFHGDSSHMTLQDRISIHHAPLSLPLDYRVIFVSDHAAYVVQVKCYPHRTPIPHACTEHIIISLERH